MGLSHGPIWFLADLPTHRPRLDLVQGVAGMVRFRRIMGHATPGEVPRC